MNVCNGSKAAAPLPRSKPRQHRLDRPEQDQDVEPRREIFDIVEIILQLGVDLVDRRDMALVDLRPAATLPDHQRRKIALRPRRRAPRGARSDRVQGQEGRGVAVQGAG